MKRSLVRCILFGTACVIIGYGIRIAIEALLTRIGWHMGGELLVLLALPCAIFAGMQIGARLALMPVPRGRRKRVPIWNIWGLEK
jgi:hypothetical protein